jgi:hypothetical protein
MFKIKTLALRLTTSSDDKLGNTTNNGGAFDCIENDGLISSSIRMLCNYQEFS